MSKRRRSKSSYADDYFLSRLRRVAINLLERRTDGSTAYRTAVHLVEAYTANEGCAKITTRDVSTGASKSAILYVMRSARAQKMELTKAIQLAECVLNDAMRQLREERKRPRHV